MINVLDHGYVRLVDHMGGDLSISRAARVSYASPPREEDAKLINYLWEHKHTTPFEAVTFTFEVHAPIFVFRQWHRHRTWSFNELSARYRELPAEYYVPDADVIGVQSTSSKQARVMSPSDIAQIDQRESEIERYTQQLNNTFEMYRELLAAGWPRELARSILPVSTYSTMFATVNLLNLFKFCTLRCDPHAQYEIRVYADAMIKLIEPIVPIATAAWRNVR